MNDKIVGLDGKPVEATPDYDTEVIETLERVLAAAKRDKANSVAVCLVVPAENENGFDIDVYWHGRKLSLLAAAGRLVHRINLKCDETVEFIT